MNAEPRCLYSEQAVGWALHALEPADEEALSEHVPQCAVCQELVRQTEEVVLVLASADEQREPRPELRVALMSAVAATPQTPVELREQPGGQQREQELVPVKVPRPSNETLWNPERPVMRSKASERSAARKRSVGRRRLAIVAATVAVAVAVIGIGGFAVRQVQLEQQQSTISAQSREVERILGQLDDRPGARRAVLQAPNGQPLAAVVLYQGERQVTPIALRANATDRSVYVLWGMGQGRPEPIGTFDISPSGSGPLPVGSVSQADQFSGYAISIENGRTSPASPSMVVASGQVAS